MAPRKGATVRNGLEPVKDQLAEAKSIARRSLSRLFARPRSATVRSIGGGVAGPPTGTPPRWGPLPPRQPLPPAPPPRPIWVGPAVPSRPAAPSPLLVPRP